MADTKRIPLFAISMFLLSSIFYARVESVDILNLRRGRNTGPSGRFAVPRHFLEDELKRLGLSGKVELLSSPMYNSSHEGEVIMFTHTSEDLTLKEELTPELLHQVTLKANHLKIALPVVASDGSHAVIILAYFSNAKSPFVSPYLTNFQKVTYIEGIEVGVGYITLKHGCDVMNVTFSYEEDCHNDVDIGADFDNVTGKDIHVSSFPAKFDWGCDILGHDVCFCKRLEPFMDDIVETNGDICTKISTKKSIRCPASMRVDKMTGVFKDAFPFFDDLLPLRSFEAEWLVREQDLGITFPCF